MQTRFFLLLLLVVSALLIPRSTPAAGLAMPPNGTPVREVRVEGLVTQQPGDITRVMALRAGSTFTAEAYRSDLQAIANLGTVDPLEIRITWIQNDDGSVDLTVYVKENPTVGAITMSGNFKYGTKTLMSQLDYEEGDLLPNDVESRTARIIRKFYSDGGYKETNVRVSTAPSGTGALDVAIDIEEGGRIRIKRLELNGNHHFSSTRLKMQTVNNGGFLFFKNYYDSEAFEDDLALIRAMYQNAGFLDAVVRRGTFEQDTKNNSITPVIEIEEGPRYKVAGVRFQGFSYFTEEELKPHFRRVTGNYFKGSQFLKGLDRVRQLYGEQGYIDTELDWNFIKDEPSRTVTVRVVAEESPVVYVGRIDVSTGPEYQPEVDINAVERFVDWFVPPTKPETIRREIRLVSGEKYRSSDEVRTRERLRNLGIFRSVAVERQPTPNPSVRDVLIKVDEDPGAAFFGVTAGVGDVSGPTISFELTNRNMGGNADRFRASATFGTRNSLFNIGYLNRYIGDSDVSANFNVYRSRARYRAYRERTYGASVEFGRPFNEYLDGLLRVRAERVDFSQYDNDAEEDFDGYYVLAVRPMLVYDRRDNRAWATRGYLVSGGVEVGAADGFLFKMLHGFEWYKTLGNSDFIYFYDHSVGLMPYDADNVGISERFFVGGTSSLRGFKYREVGPRDDGDDDLVTGGSTRLTQRHELRYPFNDFLRGRVFTDAAILEEGFLEFGTPRVGSGVGVIVDFGPFVLELDFAVPVLKESGDKTQFFHFRLSSNF